MFENRPRVFRFRFVLRARSTVYLHPYPAGALYALIAAAAGYGRQAPDAVPDGFMLDVTEAGRVRVARGDTYALGTTWLAGDGRDIATEVRQLIQGLRILGRRTDGPWGVWKGNFDLISVEDLVAGRELKDSRPEPVPARHFEAEMAALQSQRLLTLRFTSPLRLPRPSAARRSGHSFFDARYFDAGAFLHHIRRRMQGLGVIVDASARFEGAQVVKKRTEWLDLAWGPHHRRKSLGGTMGEVTVDVGSVDAIPWLVLAQYFHVGGNTRFGLGAFRIVELGTDPFGCLRAESLVDLALRPAALDRAAQDHDLNSGEIDAAATAISLGTYEPRPHAHLRIGRGGKGDRVLTIPARVDRALQRLVMEVVQPALDCFFEESSFAFRRGLSTKTAAQRIRRLYLRGFRHGWKLDFEKFFDSIDHARLETRLRVYLQDERLVHLLMTWVRAGAPNPRDGVGIPTGAPISPCLSNLFLDRFDEIMEQDGRALVRYADDFIVLFRTKEEADAAFAEAQAAAERLRMTLNADKTRALDLREPFEFLGFRFECRDRWTARPGQPPHRIEDIGWRRAETGRSSPADLARLPGEGRRRRPSPRCTLIVGPRPTTLRAAEGRLTYRDEDGREPAGLPIDRVREVLALGPVGLERSAVHALLDRGIPIFLTRHGQPRGEFRPPHPPTTADVIRQQVAAHEDRQRRLTVSRALVVAKLQNYASLAEATASHRSRADLAQQLRTLASRAEHEVDLSKLRGYEGAGAAMWYRDFNSRIGSRFRFDHRVAPDATDPVNILLNLAQTALHRQARIALDRARLHPALGIFHRPRTGHDALASDMQEPFRHLMDRAVIKCCAMLRPSDFVPDDSGPFPVRIRGPALRKAVAHIEAVFAMWCRARDRDGPQPYREHLASQARSLKRHLLDPSIPLEVFTHP